MITVSYNDYKLTPSPIVSSKTISTAQKATTSLISDNKTAERVRYSNVYNNDTSIVYTSLYSGVKEDIILNRYTNTSTFSFSLKTHGLSLVSTAGGLCLMSPSLKDPIAYIGETIVCDSVGNTSQGNIAFTTVKAYQEYTLTISVSNDFLTSKSTAYPVSIDPAIGYAKVNNMIPGRIDYNDDIDYFKFVAPKTGIYTIHLNNDLKLNATLYSPDVNPIATKNNQNYISFTQSLIGGETYWLQISDPEMTVFTADWEYAISFSVTK